MVKRILCLCSLFALLVAGCASTAPESTSQPTVTDRYSTSKEVPVTAADKEGDKMVERNEVYHWNSKPQPVPTMPPLNPPPQQPPAPVAPENPPVVTPPVVTPPVVTPPVEPPASTPSAPATPGWAGNSIIAEGKGVAPEQYANNPGRGKAMAQRAAKGDAMRNLLEQVKGLQLDSKTTVKDAVVESDEIKTQVEGYIQGCEVVGGFYDENEKLYTIKVKLNLSGVWDCVQKRYSK